MPLVVLVALISFVISIFGDEASGGASQVALLLGAGVCVVLGGICRTLTWKSFEKTISDKFAGISLSIAILLFIGALSGSWMISGVVPTLIYYGMEILSPMWFLTTACLVCAVVSVMTGSSWTTIATIGVALLGIGSALGYSETWIAGAIISGAYFGDKVSPMSDTTVLASSTAGTPLFSHIRYLLYTTVPTFLVALTVFTVVGLLHESKGAHDVTMVQNALSHTFIISPWLLAVPFLTALMIGRRLPALVVLFCGTMLACGVALLVQGELLDQIAGDDLTGIVRRVKGVMVTVYGSTALDTGVPSLNDLVATRGMSGMLGTIWLILCAVIFGAAMDASGMLQSIMRAILRLVGGLTSLVASTAFTGFFLNIMASDQYLSILLTGNMFAKTYKDRGLESRLFSRTLEDSCTVTSVLVPWNTCGMAQSSVLGVSTFAYAPYCLFNIISPFMTILVAALGWKIKRPSTPAEPPMT